MTKANSIWTIVLGLGLILGFIYVINNYSQDPTRTTFKKIVVDVFSVIFIIGGAMMVWQGGKSLAA